MSSISTKSLLRRVETLEKADRKAVPRPRNLLLEMSISAMAAAWTPDEIEQVLTAADRGTLDEIPAPLRRRWVHSLDRDSRRRFGRPFGELLILSKPPK